MRSNCPGITLYNAYINVSTRRPVYVRTQIRDVTWEDRRAANRSQAGIISANQATVYIPMTRGANYLAPRTWQALTTKTGRWTLQNGDILVRGLVSDELSDAFTATALKQKYSDVMEITSADAMDLGSASIKHWQVECA